MQVQLQQQSGLSTKGLLWSYLSQTQKDLINEGQYLMNEVIQV